MVNPTGSVYTLGCSEQPDQDIIYLPDGSVLPNAFSKFVVSVCSEFVETSSKPLRIKFPLASVGTASARELESIVGSEVGAEICTEIVTDLLRLAAQNGPPQLIHNKGVLREEFAQSFFGALGAAANDIARTSRRGLGNTIVCSLMGLSSIECYFFKEDSIGLRYEPIPNNPGFKMMPSIFHVGNFVHTKDNSVAFKVLVTTTIKDDDNSDTFLIAYKGVSETDSGYIYSPHLLVSSAGVDIDATNFATSVPLITRYSKHIKETNIDNPTLSDSQNYYRVVKVQNYPALAIK
jgi:hypothetical protein